MWKKIKKIVPILFSFFVLITLLWGIYNLILWIVSLFRNLDPTISVAIIAGAFTIIASTITVVFGKYVEASRERKAAHREKKIVFYEEYINKILSHFSSDEKESEHIKGDYLKEIHKKIILWSGPKVIISYSNWMDTLKRDGENPSAKTFIDMTKFILSVRQDLGLSNYGIKPVHIINFLLKHPGLFMQMFRKNPKVKMSEIAEVEKKYY